jgi:hypothetical protein
LQTHDRFWNDDSCHWQSECLVWCRTSSRQLFHVENCAELCACCRFESCITSASYISGDTSHNVRQPNPMRKLWISRACHQPSLQYTTDVHVPGMAVEFHTFLGHTPRWWRTASIFLIPGKGYFCEVCLSGPKKSRRRIFLD